MRRILLHLLLAGMAYPVLAERIPEIEVDVEGGASTIARSPAGWSISCMPLEDLVSAMLSESGLIGTPPADRHRVSVDVPSGEPAEVIMAAASRAGYETNFEGGKVTFRRIDPGTFGKQSLVYTFRYAHPDRPESEVERSFYELLGLSPTSGDVCRYDLRTRQVAILADRARIPALQKTLRELDARGASVELRVARVEVDRQKLGDGIAFPNNLVGQVVSFLSGKTPDGDLRMSLPEAESALGALERQGIVRARMATIVLDDGETWRARMGEGKTALAVVPTVLGRNAVKLDVQSKAPSSEEAYSFVARSGDALLFDPDQPVLELRRTATGGLLLAPTSVLESRSAADDETGHGLSDAPFTMQAIAKSIGWRSTRQEPARNGLMPQPANGAAFRKIGLASRGTNAKAAQKRPSQKKPLSKKEKEELKKKAAQKKRGFWW